MSIPLNILRITQNDIDVIGSRESVITPKKLVGGSYVEGSNYIFEINENITIPSRKTLKDFDNIIVNPINSDVTIKNVGTIDNCIITLNCIEDDSKKYRSIISNCIDTYCRMNNCSITLNGRTVFYNYDPINHSNIILNSSSIFYNYCIMFNDNITLNGSSIIYNYRDNGRINQCNSITLNSSSKLYNGGRILESCINAYDSCKIQNTCGGSRGRFTNNSVVITKYSNNCIIDETIKQCMIVDKTINDKVVSKTKMNSLNSKKKQLKNTSRNNITGNVTVKDNTLSRLFLLTYLTQNDK